MADDGSGWDCVDAAEEGGEEVDLFHDKLLAGRRSVWDQRMKGGGTDNGEIVFDCIRAEESR